MVERVPSVGTQVGQNGPAGHEDGKRHQAHPGRCAHVGCLDVLPVHDEQGRGERGLIVAWRGGPVVPRVGSQAGRHSPGVTRAKLAATTLPTASGAMADSPQLKARSDLAVGTDHSSSLPGVARSGLWAEMALAAYNLVLMAKLMPPPSSPGRSLRVEDEMP